MYTVPLEASPNQSISFGVDGASWQVRVCQATDHMYADIYRNGAALILGTRCLGGVGLLPYRYLHAPNFGNFIFDAEPDWESFGSGINLYYLTLSEFDEYVKLLGT